MQKATNSSLAFFIESILITIVKENRKMTGK